MANGVQVKFSSSLGTFVVTHGDKVRMKTESELLRHGGIVGQNTRKLIDECKAKPNRNVFCILEG